MPASGELQTPTSPKLYGGGATSRMAILLTDANSAWLGLVHGLKSFGVPLTVTTDYREAVRHQVVMVYPVLSGKVLPAEGFDALRDFVKQGGTLIGSQVLGGGMRHLFAFEEAVASAAHTSLTLSANAPLRADLLSLEDRKLVIGSAQQPIGTYAYRNPRGVVLAQFDDGTAAITRTDVGAGRAYALGIDIGAYAGLGQANRAEGVVQQYVNTFAPGADMLFLLLRAIYLAGEPDAVVLGTTPQGKKLSILLTHDIDYTRSVENALHYAAFQQSQGIAATYFVQTKYVRDWNDDVFFHPENVAKLKQLQTMGMEVASHSVAHSRQFSKLSMGDGKESYPAYAPFVRDATRTDHATVLGELRVSRYLLQAALGAGDVPSFRPGHLQNPSQLPQALQATGYQFSSSVTANSSLSHLPV